MTLLIPFKPPAATTFSNLALLLAALAGLRKEGRAGVMQAMSAERVWERPAATPATRLTESGSRAFEMRSSPEKET